MKYTRLTNEQLEELHPEFATFLASQSIDKKDWDTIKTNHPEEVGKQITIFSDMIWERALDNVNFVDNFSKNYIFLFKSIGDFVHSIIIKTTNQNINFLDADGINWLSDNLFSEEVEIQKGKKDISENRNESLFEFIKKGGIISKGELYSKLETLLNSK